MKSFYLVPTIFLIYLSSGSFAQEFLTNPTCATFMQKLEISITELFMMGTTKLPTSDEQLNIYCEKGARLLKSAKELRGQPCLTPFMKQVMNIMIPQFNKVYRFTCTTSRNEMLLNTRCMNKKDLRLIQKSAYKMSDWTKYLADKESDSAQLFPGMCCIFKYVEEQLEHVTSECSDSSTNPRKYWRGIFQSVLSSVDQLLCSRFTGNFCSDNGFTKKIRENKYHGKKEEFFMIPVFKLLSHFTDN